MSLVSNWTYPTQHLDSLRWKNRVLLVFAPHATDERLTKQLADIERQRQAFGDRDLVVFTVTDSSHEESELRSHFKVDRGGYTLILLGKDGGEKLRKHDVVRTEELLELIDSMPMRRAGGR